MAERALTLCGSLSRYPVGLGQAMHNAGYRALDLPWTYVPFRCEDLAGALAGMRALSIRGFGVSMPFKLEIMPLLDAIDPVAAKIGAVNTVVNDEGVLTGHNTDWVGAGRALAEKMDLRGACVLLLGAGGAARAVAFGLMEHGARAVLSNRSDDKGASLAAEIGAGYRRWSERHDTSSFDALVNASSAGMSDEDPYSPLASDAISPDHIVMDIVYKPLHTTLIKAAEARGATTIHGGRMLLHQAARQFELYTGRDAPLAAMDDALRSGL